MTIQSENDRIARYQRRVATTPRGVRPADPEALLRQAPAIVPAIFDFCTPISTPTGPANVLEREGAMAVIMWPDGRWRSRAGDVRGGGIVSLLMFTLDICACDALVTANLAARAGRSYASPQTAIGAEVAS